MPEPAAVWSGELSLSGVTLHVHVLGDGTRIIDVDDLQALMRAWEDGAMPDGAEVEAFARWRAGEPLPDLPPKEATRNGDQ